MKVNRAMPMPDTYWAITVACAAPETPHLRPITKPQVQDNVKSGGDGEKYQWYYGISQRPKQRCEKL